MKEWLSLFSGILLIFSYLPYFRAIFMRETKPMKVTWLIWASLDSLLMVGMLLEGAFNWHVFFAMIGSWIVVILAFQGYGKSGWGWTDKLSMVGAFIAVGIILIGSNSVNSLIVSGIAMIIGAIPTFGSAARSPKDEDRFAWTLGMIACIFALAAIPVWDVENAAQPVTFTIIQLVMMILLYLPRKQVVQM